MQEVSDRVPSPPDSELEPGEPESSIVKPRSFIEKNIKKITVRIARFLSQWSWITPNKITLLSATIGGPLAGWIILQGQGAIATLFIIFSGILDDLDGDLARERGMASKEGAILDSVLDRYVDFSLISALILVSPSHHLIPGLLALMGATLVPYIRARSEAEGKSTISSIGDRTTRTIVLIIGLLTGQIFAMLIVLAVISNIAALHRLIFALIPGNGE